MNAVTVTPAQHAVVTELARDGADNDTIGMRLGIANNTVKTHLKRALAASGKPNRTALALAVARGDIAFHIKDGRDWRNTTNRITRGQWT